MSRKNALKKLQALGYARSEDFIAPIQRETAPPQPKSLENKSFKGEILNHTIMENITLQGCNYDEACVTGSIFRNCRFIDCTMDRADFEFCEFYQCEFSVKKIFSCSFNNSSFVESSFSAVYFDSCTFTGAYFQRCPFDRVHISYSTLENALFKQCSFYHMDIRYLNMDYIDLEHPYMEDVVLPISQVAFIFGAPQYLINTKDIVFVSKGNQGRMTTEEFFRKVVPLLCYHFEKTRQFFPLANINFAIGNGKVGTYALKQGLKDSMVTRDFRMLKHYCKLAACSGVFHPSDLRKIYHECICRLYPQYSAESGIPNYARHITEIQTLLFSKARKPAFSITFQTNIQQGESGKIGKFVNWLFSMARHGDSFQNDDVELVLGYRSPLSVTVHVGGEENALAALLSAYLRLTGMTTEEILELPVVSECRSQLPTKTGCWVEFEDAARKFHQELRVLSINMDVLEYYIENFHVDTFGCETAYYFNSAAVPNRVALSDKRR